MALHAERRPTRTMAMAMRTMTGWIEVLKRAVVAAMPENQAAAPVVGRRTHRTASQTVTVTRAAVGSA